MQRDIYVFEKFSEEKVLKNLSLQEIHQTFTAGKKQFGKHVLYKPIKNDIFTRCSNEKSMVLNGFLNRREKHFTALIPKKEDFLMFTPKFIWFADLKNSFCNKKEKS